MSTHLSQEIVIYKYFNSKGFTSAEAKTQLKLLKRDSSFIQISNIKTLEFSEILKRAKIKKTFPNKLGKKILFAKISMNNEKYIIITRNSITDFDEMRTYWIKNEKDLQWMSQFIDDIYSLNK